MEPGSLKARLILQQPSTTQDAVGQPVVGWTEVARVWGDVRYQSGLESIRAGADTSVAKVSVRIRRRPGITAAMRLVDATSAVVYQINAQLPDSGKDSIDMVCEVVT